MYEKELAAAKNAALKAGAFLGSYPKLKIDSSEGKDIKLSCDRESEALIFDSLKETNIPLLGEESGSTAALKNRYWIVDPLDGSANYIKGNYELTCVSIALWDNGRPVLGVVYRWFTKELFWGCAGNGAFMNDKPITPSGIQRIGDAMIATGFPVKRKYDDNSLYAFISVVQKFKKVRMLGAAALMCSFVACGRVDAYVEDDIMIWDVAAAVAIVTAAGGACRITDKQDHKCLCACFASQELLHAYFAEV